MMTVRAKDIAELLNISPATVSLVLNNKPGVSETTRSKVISKINELGYEHLLKKDPSFTENILFIVYKKHGQIIMDSPFYPFLIENIEANVRKNGYKLIVSYVESEHISYQIEQLKSSSNKGLLVFATEMLEDDAAYFCDLNIPFVIMDNYFRGRAFDSVSINNSYGTYLAVKHLVEMGHSKIGYLKSKVHINSFDERIQDFFTILKDLQIEGMDKYVFEIGYPAENSYSDFKKILEDKRELPTAFLSDHDLITYGVSKALKEGGYRIPEDVSLIGFGDRPICKIMEPNLTTIGVPKDSFGSLAVKILLDKINDHMLQDDNSFLKVQVGTSLIKRDSVMKL